MPEQPRRWDGAASSTQHPAPSRATTHWEPPARGCRGKSLEKSPNVSVQKRLQKRNEGSSGMQSPGLLKYIGFLLSFFIGNDPFDTFT